MTIQQISYNNKGSEVESKISLIVIFTMILLSGCASKIMQSYVGKDVREVVLDYGPPSNAMDMGKGIRAFQWTKSSSYTTPTYVSSSGTGTGYGSSYTYGNYTNYNMNTYVNTNTVIRGGQTINSTCVYTLFARWNKGRNGWIVTSFKKPDFLCE